MNWLLRLGQIAWQLFMPMPICIWTTRLNILSWQTNCSTASHHFFNWLSVRSLASHVNSVSLLLPNGPRIATWELTGNLGRVHGPALRIIVTGCAKPTVWVHAHIRSLRYSSDNHYLPSIEAIWYCSQSATWNKPRLMHDASFNSELRSRPSKTKTQET